MLEERKILYGTGNQAKLEGMRKWLKGLKLEVIGLKELGCGIPDVPEDGKTPLENARKKALAYYEAFGMPVFSCDSGLYFDNVPDSDQPGIHVRNVGGKRLSDQEMMEHYCRLARKYGNLTARYKNAVCLVLSKEEIYEAMEPEMESERFLITSTPHPDGIRKQGFPLDALSLEMDSGKYFYDLGEGRLDKVAAEDGFLQFFERILGDGRK